ncbi:replication protein A [Methanolapillus millepedarum]|uniref:Replication factor A n=1 Tax=Methanolapillus millepedarum TaxID=3028296 RepID=A0AA96V3Q7_9EURY|nr:hypothetical protein MsAc7_15790 [Methanosarcinaceae archaeon Ac7]
MTNMTNTTEKGEKPDRRKKSESKNEHIVAETLEKYEIPEKAQPDMTTEMTDAKPDEIKEPVGGHPDKNTGTSDDLISECAGKILKNFSEKNIELSADEVSEKLRDLIFVYKVPPFEAERTVSNVYAKRHNLSKTEVLTGRGAKSMKIEEIPKPDMIENSENVWLTLEGKVIQLWDNPHESIAQAGLLGDETGVIKFTLWGNAGHSALKLNQSYQLKNVIVKTWNGKTQIELNKATSVSSLDRNIQVLPFETAAEAGKQKNNEMRTVSELNKDGVWTDISAKVVQVFDKSHDSITVAGILGDATGTIRFTMWKTAECEPVEAGKSYLFTNVIVKEWNGKYAIELNKSSRLEELSEEVVVKSASVEVTGCAVDIQAGSGLVKRCPECNKVLSKGSCGDHGKVKGKYDLRIKAVIDDGINAQETIINCVLTEQILKMTLDDAVSIATETLDPESIADIIKKDFLGKYYTVTGAKTDRYIIAETIEPAMPIDAAVVKELKSRIELERLEYEIFGNKIGNENEKDRVFEPPGSYSENMSVDSFDSGSFSESGRRTHLDTDRKKEFADIGYEFESVAKEVI